MNERERKEFKTLQVTCGLYASALVLLIQNSAQEDVVFERSDLDTVTTSDLRLGCVIDGVDSTYTFCVYTEEEEGDITSGMPIIRVNTDGEPDQKPSRFPFKPSIV